MPAEPCHVHSPFPRAASVAYVSGVLRPVSFVYRSRPLSRVFSLLRLCWQMLAPPQSLQTLLSRLCEQMLAPPQFLLMSSSGGYAGRYPCPRSPCIRSSCGYAGRCWRPRSPCPHASACCVRPSSLPSSGGLLCASSFAPPVLRSPPPWPAAAAPVRNLPRLAPRGTRGTYPAASRARTCPCAPALCSLCLRLACAAVAGAHNRDGEAAADVSEDRAHERL